MAYGILFLLGAKFYSAEKASALDQATLFNTVLISFEISFKKCLQLETQDDILLLVAKTD